MIGPSNPWTLPMTPWGGDPKGSPSNPFASLADVVGAYPVAPAVGTVVYAPVPYRYAGPGVTASDWVQIGISPNRWVFDGDSITAGFGGVQAMAAFLNGKMVIVGNVGVPGKRLDEMLARIDATLAYHANVWLIAGTNDAGQSRSLSAYTADLISYIRKVRAVGLDIIISLIPPHNTQPLNAEKINNVIRRVCHIEGVQLNDPWETMRANDGTWIAENSGDGVHPYGYVLPTAAASANAQMSSYIGKLPGLFPCLAQPDGGLRTNCLFLTDTNSDGVADNINMDVGLVGSLANAVNPKLGKIQSFTATAYAGNRSSLIFGGAITPGDKVLALMRVAFDPQSTTNTRLEAKFVGDYGAKTHGNYFGGSGIPLTAPIEGVIAKEFTAVAASSSFDVSLSMNQNSGGTITGKLSSSQCQFYNLTALGLA